MNVTNLERKLKAAMRELGLVDARSFLVAVSGGADSVSLLDALARLKSRGKLSAQLFVAHLNHQLRAEESDDDEAFVIQLARQHGFDHFIERCPVAEISRNEKANLEATARRTRYEFLVRTSQGCRAEFVLTAHTQDDQAETILMRLLRGSGAEGLRGIRRIRPLDPFVSLARPMLTVTRNEVLEYCERYNLIFRTDSSNFLPDFTRNRIRQELIPLLRSFNPRSDDALVRLAGLLTDDQDVLQQIAADALTGARVGGELNTKELRKLPPAVRRRVLRLWLEEKRGNLQRIEAIHIAALERLIRRNQGGRVVELPGNWRVRLKSGILSAYCPGHPLS